MSKLVWDELENRTFETGVEKGTLYLKDGRSVVWNGLVSVSESPDRTATPHYFGGRKIADSIDLGNYSATLKAITYPDEFLEVEGYHALEPGAYFGHQPLKSFGLSYRTLLGDGVEHGVVGYRLHILYNLTAIPSNKIYRSLSSDMDAMEFEWKLTSVPESFMFMRPTSHIFIDSTKFDPARLSQLEDILYGTDTTDPKLISPPDLMQLIGYV